MIMISSGFLINSPAIAAPSDNANDKANRTFKLPDDAVEIAPGIFHIATVIHEGKVVDGIAVFHHKDGHDKGGPPGGGGDGGTGDTTSTCFAYIAKGVKWKVPENYNVDPSNNAGLDEALVRTNMASAIAAWDDQVTFNIIGSEDASITVDGIDTVSPDGKNEVLFGNIDSAGAIAVNILWGHFRGPPSERDLIEWDQMYNHADFDWSLSGETGKMDFLNIATHEVGHATGMAHPDNTCTEETMYAFAELGETKKRDLNSGDITGIRGLYT